MKPIISYANIVTRIRVTIMVSVYYRSNYSLHRIIPYRVTSFSCIFKIRKDINMCVIGMNWSNACESKLSSISYKNHFKDHIKLWTSFHKILIHFNRSNIEDKQILCYGKIIISGSIGSKMSKVLGQSVWTKCTTINYNL